MNPEAQERLDEILKKDPVTLSEDDIKFLRARRSYLKKSQLEEYGNVLENQTSDTETVKQHGRPKK